MTENDKIALQKALTEWYEIRQSNSHRIDALQTELDVLRRQDKRANTSINSLRKRLGEE